MSLAYADRVMETSTTTGTGTYTLAGAVTGYQSFAAIGDGNTCVYCAEAVDAAGNPSGDWEVGIGTYTVSGTTLARTTILSSSNSGSAVNWAAGTRRVFVTLAAARQGLVLLEEHTASSSASLDFTTAISSAYDDYQIEIVNIIPATNNVEFVMRVSTDGGSTWQTSNYFWNYNYAGTAADSGTQGSGSDTAAKIGTSINNTTSFGGTVGTVKLRSPLSTSFAKVYEMHMEQRSASASEYYSLNGGGGWNSTTAVNAVQFLMSSDNIASGTIRVYGVAK